MEALTKLEEAWDLLAPKADKGFVMKYARNMRKEGASEREIFRSVVGRFYDGLAYGNWPSAI